jgi:uncharacterized membrane protein YkoI
MRISLLLGLLSLVAATAPADARPHRRDQDAAFQATREGKIMPLRLIEARVLPRMQGADYLGPELDVASGRYRLKFMRRGRVIWVDVDARTGRIVGMSGD